jgi:hypothetical protein
MTSKKLSIVRNQYFNNGLCVLMATCFEKAVQLE